MEWNRSSSGLQINIKSPLPVSIFTSGYKLVILKNTGTGFFGNIFFSKSVVTNPKRKSPPIKIQSEDIIFIWRGIDLKSTHVVDHEKSVSNRGSTYLHMPVLSHLTIGQKWPLEMFGSNPKFSFCQFFYGLSVFLHSPLQVFNSSLIL